MHRKPRVLFIDWPHVIIGIALFVGIVCGAYYLIAS